MEQSKPKLLDQVCDRCRMKGYSLRTAITYRHWCEDYLRFHRRRCGEWVHPDKMGRSEIEQYLTHLAVKRRVSPTTQNVAFQSLLFLYREILGITIDGVDALRAKRPQRMPTVLSREEVAALLDQLAGPAKLIAMLLYGCGLRIGEALSLRVKDIDFANQQIVIRAAKGMKDRVVQLPRAAETLLRQQVATTASYHADDVRDGVARVPLPNAFDRKSPTAASQLAALRVSF